MNAPSIFAEWAPIYRDLGLEPRPIKPGGKACKVRGWQKPDSEIGQDELARWFTQCADHGIGLRMGTPLPGGGYLGALDVDDNNYVAVTRAVLRDLQCGRFGSKGAVFFVRVLGNLPSSKFKPKTEGRGGKAVVECLFDKTLCVIPPTIHPVTGKPYEWIGTPLHELDLDRLPIIGE